MEKMRTSKCFVEVFMDSIVAPKLDCSSTANPGRIEYAMKNINFEGEHSELQIINSENFVAPLIWGRCLLDLLLLTTKVPISIDESEILFSGTSRSTCSTILQPVSRVSDVGLTQSTSMGTLNGNTPAPDFGVADAAPKTSKFAGSLRKPTPVFENMTDNEGKQETAGISVSFEENSSQRSWRQHVSHMCVKILWNSYDLLKVVGFLVEWTLNLLSLNNGVFGLLYRLCFLQWGKCMQHSLFHISENYS